MGTQPPPVEEITFPPRNICPQIVPARKEGDGQRQRPDPPPQEATTATMETTSETTLTVGSTEVSSSDQTTAATITTTTSVTTALTVEDIVDLEDSETDSDDEFEPGKISAIEDLDMDDDYSDWIPDLKNETRHNKRYYF